MAPGRGIAYAERYNLQRPHRGFVLAASVPKALAPGPIDPLEVRRRNVLGGLIHEYHEAAA